MKTQMVAAARYANEYDGFLAGNPGFHLPKSAVEQLWKVQQYARIATGTTAKDAGQPDITTAVTPAEFKLVGASIVAKCDALDGVKDGIVSDVLACQNAFDIKRDVDLPLAQRVTAAVSRIATECARQGCSGFFKQ